MLHLIVAIPFFAGIVGLLAYRWVPKVHTGWFIFPAPLLLFLYFISQIPTVQQQLFPQSNLPWIPSLEIYFTLVLDGLSMLMSLLITGIGALVVWYSIFYMDRTKNQLGPFYLYLMMFMGAMLGIVLSDNTIVLYGFWELTSISSFLLIGYKHESIKSAAGALKSLMITVLGGFCMLGGIILLRIMSGTFSIRETIAALGPITEHWMFMPAMILILIGAFSKSAQFPFHIWLPDAMEAPTPVSAYLHSATMVKAGIYLVARLTPVFAGNAAWFWTISSVGLITLCYGAFSAIRKNDMKALLAYSTISQLGLIMTLFGLGSAALYRGTHEPVLYTTATLAGIFHLFNHALFKGALFMSAGIVDHATGTRDMRKLGGLITILPATFTITVIGGLSMAGIPPFSGFLSKEQFLKATVDMMSFNFYGLETWGTLFPVLAWIGSVFTFIYSVVLLSKPFLGEPHSYLTSGKVKSPPIGMLIPPAILVILVIVFGLFPNVLSYTLLEPAMISVLPSSLTEGEHIKVHLSMWHGWTPELFMTIGVMLVGALLYYTRHRWFRVYGFYPHQLSINTLFTQLFRRSGNAARRLTELYMNGSVRNYLVYIFAFSVLLLGYTFYRASVIPWDQTELAPIRIYELLILAGLIAAAICIPLARERLSAVILTGAVGYLVTLFFVLFRAPDLALTQMIVETISVALMLLCFYHLPELRSGKSSRSYRTVNLIIAVSVGTIMTLIALAATRSENVESISRYFTENSYKLAGGKNIVNVLLVDFRGFDTLLEIAVLGVASLAIYGMIHLSLDGKDLGARTKFHNPTSVQAFEKQRDLEQHSLIWSTVPLRSNDIFLQTLMKIVIFIVLTFALHLFFAGHHEPGGGFIGGLVTAAALILLGFAFRTETMHRVIRLDYRQLTAVGLLIAVLTGMGSFLFEAPFLSHTFGYFDLPLLGTTELATALLFDIGVYMTVIGVTMTIITQIGEDR